MAVFSNKGHFPLGEFLGASALTVIGCLKVARAETAPPPAPRKSDTFVECTILMDKCMPGTSSAIKAALDKHFKIRKDSISCK